MGNYDSSNDATPVQETTQENINSPPAYTPSEQDFTDFFRLDDGEIEHISINSFLQECQETKLNYFKNQNSNFNVYSMQPHT